MNEYPRGKLNADDEGATTIAMTVKDRTVIISFSKPMEWIGFDQMQAVEFARLILKRAGATKVEVTLGGPPE